MSTTKFSTEGGYTAESRRTGVDQVAAASVIPEGNVDPIYEAKAKILNDAMHEIGFGRYHKALFVVAGFGWLADNVC